MTLNAEERIGLAHRIERIVYEHPVLDAEAVAAQRLHHLIDGQSHTHFCGAYWGYGFHEDGLRSAQRVASTLGGAL